MAAPTLTADQQRELAALRGRAYGPGADIDEHGLARLDELEALTRTRVEAAKPEPAAPAAAGVGEPKATREAAEPDAPHDQAAADTEPRRHRGPRWHGASRRLRELSPLAWTIIGATVMVLIAIVWGVGRVTALDSDLSLASVTTDDRPPANIERQGYFGAQELSLDSLQQYESYRTLQLWSLTGADGQRCLFIAAPQVEGVMTGSCTPAGLDPSSDFYVWRGLPAEVAEGLPEGSVIRFVLRGDRVHVWERASSETA